MSSKEDLERIERCKYEIADSERRGQGYSDNYIRARKEELHELTTSPEDRIKEDEATLAYLAKDVVFSGAGYESEKAAMRRIAAAKREIAGKSSEPVKPQPPTVTVFPVVLQGGVGGIQQKGLHTPSMQEIMQKANQPDPTAPYFNPNTDVPTLVDPLAPHPDFSGEVPRIVNPLKPGPKISGPA